MERRDGALHLVRSRASVAEGLVEEREPLRDAIAVPQATVLIFEENDRSVRVEPRLGPRVLQEHERCEPEHLRLRRKQPEEDPGQTDGLVAQRDAHVGAAARRRVPLVEEEVEDGGHGRQALRAFRRTRRLEGDLLRGDAVLGPRDPLLHRDVAHQERAGDLGNGEAADDPQREGDLLRGGELRVAAHEEQSEEVVAVVRVVELLGERALGVAQVGQRHLPWQLALLFAPSHAVERGVAADEDEPRHGVARRAVFRPALERA